MPFSLYFFLDISIPDATYQYRRSFNLNFYLLLIQKNASIE